MTCRFQDLGSGGQGLGFKVLDLGARVKEFRGRVGVWEFWGRNGLRI